MADFTITASAVLASTSAQRQRFVAGETITQGMPVYLDTATNTLKKCVGTNVSGANAAGIALSASSLGQPLFYAISDPAFTHGIVTPSGATSVAVSGAAAGGLAPAADITTLWFPNVILLTYGDSADLGALSCGPLYTPEATS